MKELLCFLFSLPPLSVSRRRLWLRRNNWGKCKTLSPDINDRAHPTERLMLCHQGACVGLGTIRRVNNLGLGRRWALKSPDPFSMNGERTWNFSEMVEKYYEVRGYSNMGDEADRPCILVWKQVCVQEAWPYWNSLKACRHPLLPSCTQITIHFLLWFYFLKPSGKDWQGLCICPGFDGFLSFWIWDLSTRALSMQ